MEKVKISKGNMKTGRIPAISLPPVRSCRSDAPCKKDCYAMKAFRMYPKVRTAWTHNLDLWESNPRAFEQSLATKLSKTRKTFFRWHVSGDIPDPDYYAMMIRIAKQFPGIRFLAFTKRYEIANLPLAKPENLTIVFSAWPGLEMKNPGNYPVAYMQDGTETRVPADALECPGNCETCGMCWSLPALKKDVVFHKH